MKPEPLPNATQPEDMQQSRTWLGGKLSAPQSLPFSFIYDGHKITGIPQAWNPFTQTRRIDANLIVSVVTGKDPVTGLIVRAELTQYLDYPVAEWVVWLMNYSSQPSALIQDLLVLDGVFEGASPVLDHSNGDYYSVDGYTPLVTSLQPGMVLKLAPTGGRPCDGAFPYFRLQFEGCGLTMAVGWPGQWAASFTRVEGGVHITAGQELTHLRLMPGEKIRTPRMHDPFLGRGTHPGGEPVAPLVPGPYPAPPGWQAVAHPTGLRGHRYRRRVYQRQ